MRGILLVVAAALLTATAGCTAVEEPNPSKKVVIEDTHRCIGSCDHIFVEGGWRMVPNHKHGPDCGHYLIRGRWVKDRGEGRPVEGEGPKETKRDY